MKSIGFIGGGKMAQSIVKGLLKNKRILPRDIIVSDPNKYQHEHFNSLDISTTTCNKEVTKNKDIVVFATKPQILSKVFNEIYIPEVKNSLIFSILAGVPTQTFVSELNTTRVVRIMPNTPCIIGKGMSVWYSENCLNSDVCVVEDFLNSIGKQIRVDDEKYIDMATAISGSGPSYVYLLAESMVDAGVHMGLSREKAKEMVNETLKGSAEYLCLSDQHPSILRNEITSPGGTSASALYSFEKSGFRASVSDAIWAAYKRTLTLSK